MDAAIFLPTSVEVSINFSFPVSDHISDFYLLKEQKKTIKFLIVISS
jgi:hypothetical protein